MVRGTVGPMSGAERLASDIGRKRFFVAPVALRLMGVLWLTLAGMSRRLWGAL